VFTRISDEMGMPILSISVDEQTGRAGIQTRLEAFIDLVWSRKERAAEPARLRA
jgi:predicted nucleotide-binding protein (sugar kinase/HSP70/actin superfamily)